MVYDGIRNENGAFRQIIFFKGNLLTAFPPAGG